MIFSCWPFGEAGFVMKEGRNIIGKKIHPGNWMHITEQMVFMLDKMRECTYKINKEMM